MCIHLIICEIVDTKYVQITIDFLCFFNLGLYLRPGCSSICLLQLVLSHLDITILIQLVYCISIGQCTFFISYSGSLLFANTIFDFLHLIPCFSRMFLISAWLILSTSFISLIINPASTRNNDHVENGNP